MSERSLRPLQIVGQVLVYAAFAGALGYFSARPTYTHLDPDLALLRVSFSHAGEPTESCRRYTQAELDELAPNMRRPMDCPRRRVPLEIEIEIDGEVAHRASLPPSGIAGDGTATVYQAFPLAAGSHSVAARLRDTRRTSGFDWGFSGDVRLEPGEVQVLDFSRHNEGFKLLPRSSVPDGG